MESSEISLPVLIRPEDKLYPIPPRSTAPLEALLRKPHERVNRNGAIA